MKDLNSHKLKFSPYLEKLYQSDKPLIIYKVKNGYNLYTDFSKKIVLTNHNIDKFFNIFSNVSPDFTLIFNEGAACLILFLINSLLNSFFS